jgi:hypothetical protein
MRQVVTAWGLAYQHARYAQLQLAMAARVATVVASSCTLAGSRLRAIFARAVEVVVQGALTRWHRCMRASSHLLEALEAATLALLTGEERDAAEQAAGAQHRQLATDVAELTSEHRQVTAGTAQALAALRAELAEGQAGATRLRQQLQVRRCPQPPPPRGWLRVGPSPNPTPDWLGRWRGRTSLLPLGRWPSW